MTERFLRSKTDRLAAQTWQLQRLASEPRPRTGRAPGEAPRPDIDGEWIGVVDADGRVLETLQGEPPALQRIVGAVGTALPAIDQVGPEPVVQIIAAPAADDAARRVVGRISTAALLGPLARTLNDRALVALLDEMGRLAGSAQKAIPSTLLDVAHSTGTRQASLAWGDGRLPGSGRGGGGNPRAGGCPVTTRAIPSARGVPAAGGHDPDEGKVRVHA